MNKGIRTVRARSAEEVADAQRIRAAVFVDDIAVLTRSEVVDGREVDEHDDRESTIHIVGYWRGAPAGAARLLVRGARTIAAGRSSLDIPLAGKYDLSPFDAPGLSIAEVSRFCVVPRFRCRGMVEALYLALLEESLSLGVTHWVASVTTATPRLEEAWDTFAAAEAAGLVSKRWRVAPWARDETASRARLSSSPLEAGSARRLPAALSVFTGLGAHIMGPPVDERPQGYCVCSVPIVLDLEAASSRLRGRPE